MTAKEANRISKENVNESTLTELNKINSRIKDAAETGYFQTILYYKIADHIKEHYQELGYEIVIKPQQNQLSELITFIKW